MFEFLKTPKMYRIYETDDGQFIAEKIVFGLETHEGYRSISGKMHLTINSAKAEINQDRQRSADRERRAREAIYLD